MTPVTIIGAGWAGLAAAVELSRQQIPVTVYESARHIGGRARDVELDNITVDNGQHLMIGAYSQLLNLLTLIGVDESQLFSRLPQHICVYDLLTRHSVFDLKLPRLPAPLHLLAGMFSTPSLSFADKLKTLWHFNRLLHRKLATDISVTQWLNQSGLPGNYVKHLLYPLCLAALTTHPDLASARAFQTVLTQTFAGPSQHTDLLIAKTTLGKTFPDAAKNYIESYGGQILTGHKVTQLNPQTKTLVVNDAVIDYQQLIIATPAQVCQQLLQTHNMFAATTNQLSQLQYEPVCTVYLQYPEPISLPLAMIGCVNSVSEWLFDRRYCNQPGLIAVVISAHGEHMIWSNDILTKKISAELAQLFPAWPQPLHTQVIREKRAAFRCHTHIDSIRPGINTASNSIKLCGDYVYIENNFAAGLPATLEGAVRSGVKCAHLTLQELPACNT